MLSIEANLQTAIQSLVDSGSDSPALDAAVLMCHVLNKPRSYLLTWPERMLDAEQQLQFDKWVAKRAKGEPVAYIVGKREFWSLPLQVSTSTLIPRADTERLVELAIDKLSLAEGGIEDNILDLGTGTGAIALALASEFPQRKVIGVDLQKQAQQLATNNAKNLNINNAQFLQGSWFEPLKTGSKFACIVSNPPYIDKMDPHLAQGDVRFEPLSALVAEEKGLADLRYIADKARQYLQQGGWLLMEHGFEQGEAVCDLLIQYGYSQVSTEQDYANNDRVTLGCWSQ